MLRAVAARANHPKWSVRRTSELVVSELLSDNAQTFHNPMSNGRTADNADQPLGTPQERGLIAADDDRGIPE
jgi:hypothetical protein